MMELLKTMSVTEVQHKTASLFEKKDMRVEEVPLLDSLHRILASPVTSPHDVPEFNRSTVDGYAVRAEDTFGASDGVPAMLVKKGEVHMGTEASVTVEPGECVYVPTGGMLPPGANGMVMVEYVEHLDENTLLVQQSVSPGANLLRKGEDLLKNEVIFDRGHRLRPQDIGLLAGMGFQKVSVYEPLKVAVISTGDELISPEEALSPGKIIDMNTYSLSAALKEDGFKVIGRSVVKDEMETLQLTLRNYMQKADIILISGGSSMGEYDITKKAIDSMGQPGALVHGMSVKPGKPTIVGMAEGILMIGLPGQPVSALVVYHLLMKPLLQKLTGHNIITPTVSGELTVNLPSAPGREHYVMVTLQREDDDWKVSPQHGKSGMLSMMGRSQGMVKIPVNREGLSKGDRVDVILF